MAINPKPQPQRTRRNTEEDRRESTPTKRSRASGLAYPPFVPRAIRGKHARLACSTKDGAPTLWFCLGKRAGRKLSAGAGCARLYLFCLRENKWVAHPFAPLILAKGGFKIGPSEFSAQRFTCGCARALRLRSGQSGKSSISRLTARINPCTDTSTHHAKIAHAGSPGHLFRRVGA